MSAFADGSCKRRMCASPTGRRHAPGVDDEVWGHVDTPSVALRLRSSLAPDVAAENMEWMGYLCPNTAALERVDKEFLKRRLGEDDGWLYEYKWADNYYYHDLGEEPEPYLDRFIADNHEG